MAGHDHRRTGFASAVIDTGDDATNLTSYAATGLTAATGYIARVRYKDSAGGYSSWSLAASFTTDATALVAGTIAFVSSGPAGLACSETVAASGGTAPITRQWQRSDDGGSYADLSGQTGSTLSDTTATTAGTAYRYQVVYTDAAGTPQTADSNVVGPIYMYAGCALNGVQLGSPWIRC